MESVDLALDRLSSGCVTLLGLPDDANSSYLRGSSEAPVVIRKALSCESSNLSTEGGDIHHPLIISIDLDVLDPAYAPGVSHHEPGGLSTRDVLRLFHAVPVRPVGADLVELNPSRDGSGISSLVAAKLVKELVPAMLHG